MSLPFEQSRHICRIVDASNPHYGINVGTVVLVSDGGGAFGYALTCWHNFDVRHWLTITEDTSIDGVFLIPNADRVENPEHRRPVIVVAKWSNVHMDVAVLKIPRAVIIEFGLHPVAITFDLYESMELRVIGFQRPGQLRYAGGVNVKVVALYHALWVDDWNTEVRVFEVTSLDGKAEPYDPGMSGGAMIHAASGTLVGLAEGAVPSQMYDRGSLGYGISIDTIARGWPLITEHCRVKRAHPWRLWLRRVAIGIAALAVAALIRPPERPPASGTDCRTSNVGKAPHKASTVSVHRWYGPSGEVGDTGDLTIGKGKVKDGGDRFVYETRGVGPRNLQYTSNATIAPIHPARFAGVTYLSPASCWGFSAHCGYDLRKYSRLYWEARSGNALTPRVEFFIGTDNKTRHYVNGAWETAAVACPGTVSTYSFGTYSLSQAWQPFDRLLDDLAPNRSRVIGGFGWQMNWAANGIEADGSSPREAKTFVIEIRNIRYAK